MRKVALLALLFGYTFAYTQNISYRNLFDDNIVPKVHIKINEDTLHWLNTNEFSEKYLQADFVFDDGTLKDTVKGVGLRLRGNSCRFASKKSYKVKFNAFTKGVRYQGVKELNLVAEFRDPTMSREKLFYDVWNRFGLPARRTTHTQLYINDVYYGLYTNAEEIDDVMMKRLFGSDKGNLYKCLHYASLGYVDDNPDSYKNYWNSTILGGRSYDLKTNEEANDYSDLAAFIKVINKTPEDQFQTEIQKVLNVDNFLKGYAVEAMLGHWDGYGYNAGNYFLYRNPKTNQFEYFCYDTDNTFGIDFWTGQDFGKRDLINWHRADYGHLVERLLKVPDFKEKYKTYLKDLAINVLSNFKPHIDSVYKRIEKVALADGNRKLDYGFTDADFKNNFNYTPTQHAYYGLKGYIDERIKPYLQEPVQVTSIALADNSTAIKVYPNPVRDVFFVEVENVEKVDADIQILNQNGILIKEIKSKLSKIGIPTEGMSPGLYYIKILNEQKVTLKKIVIVK